MDKLSQERFDKLVASDPSSLTAEERTFLRARRTYLTEDQRRVFKNVLEEKTLESSDDTPETPKAPQNRHEELESLTNAELTEILEERKVDLPEKVNKENLVKAVEDSE